MARPMLLTYNLNQETAARLEAVCREQGILLRAVKPFEYAAPIGALAGIPVAKGSAGLPTATFTDDMLVMCHMLSDQLDAFLQGMRAGGVPRIPLKAVLTPTNVTWDSLRLHDELAREHAAMGGR